MVVDAMFCLTVPFAYIRICCKFKKLTGLALVVVRLKI